MPTFTVSIPGGRIGNFLAGAVVASVIGGTAIAITSPDFTYTTTKTGYYTIGAMAVIPNRSSYDYVTFHIPEQLTPSTGACFSTAVNLPQGSRITQLAVWYASSATSNPHANLIRTRLVDGTSTSLLASELLTDESSTRKLGVLPIAGGSSLVSNTGFTYGFGFCTGVGATFFGARIAYTYTSAGD